MLAAGAVVILLVAAGGATLLHRAGQQKALARETAAAAIPSVLVTGPSPIAGGGEIVLPATLEAWQESPVYARTNGYLLRWTKDIGSPVRQGELLALIDTPEVDQELAQAQAMRQQVASQMQLAQISATRWQNLRKSDSVSQQETDQQTSALQQGRANLAAADANVRRLQQLEGFKRVTAPFSGVLTKRNVENGALINSGASGKELFDIAQVGTLRVYIALPQAYVNEVKAGSKTYVTLQEFPGVKFVGVVARTSQAIDPATRTLLTEVDLPNPGGKLLPGSFGQVHFAVSENVQRVTVPVSALIFRKEGPRVAVIAAGDKAMLRPVVIGRDFGASLEIVSGVEASDQIVINPSDSLENGDRVQVVKSKAGETE
jgi:RND family efflux transporter MFP subunit